MLLLRFFHLLPLNHRHIYENKKYHQSLQLQLQCSLGKYYRLSIENLEIKYLNYKILNKIINFNPYGQKPGLPKYKNLILTVKYIENLNKETNN